MSPPWGELAALGAALAWAVSSVLFAAERAHARPVVLTMLKGGISVLFFTLCIVLTGSLARWPETRPALVLAFSGVAGITLGDTFYFLAMSRLGVRKASLLSLLNPGFAAVLAGLLGQALPGALGWVGIALTLLGVVLVVQASPAAAGERDPRSVSGAAFGVGSAVMNAVGIVVAKSAIGEVGVLPTALIRQGAAFVALLGFELLVRRGRDLHLELLRGYRRPRLIAASLTGACFGFLLFQIAIDRSSAPVTGALSSTVPLWIAPMAAFFLGERLPARAALATLVAVLGVVLLVCF
ncbi:MAG: DMT family transporter [Candidatus Eisenbacteria bacterium]|nr:DMT family transporter [Candidatus Eisenbacteria bacterium]